MMLSRLRRIICVLLFAGLLISCDVASSAPNPAATPAVQPGAATTSQPALGPATAYPAPGPATAYPALEPATAYPAPTASP